MAVVNHAPMGFASPFWEKFLGVSRCFCGPQAPETENQVPQAGPCLMNRLTVREVEEVNFGLIRLELIIQILNPKFSSPKLEN